MSAHTPGSRVRLVLPVGVHPAGAEGVVKELGATSLNGYDVAVQLGEGLDSILCFYDDQLEPVTAP